MKLKLPEYQCFKKVRALKIKQIKLMVDEPYYTAYPEDGDYPPFKLLSSYVRKFNPQPGGYYVVYEDGYKSYSPAEAFEKGYTLINEN